MNTVERTCPVCSAIYFADAQRLKHGRQTTCSRKCSYLLRANQLSSGLEVSCSYCGALFKRSLRLLAKPKHGAAFCSPECHYAARGCGIVKRTVLKPYRYTESGKAAMLAASKRPKGKRIFRWIECDHCGKQFVDPSDGRKRKSGLTFCSLSCCNSYRTGKNNPSWRGGHLEYYGPNWRPLRRAARKRDNYSCRRCGVKTHRAPDVHHIRPISNFSNPDDANTLDNVICLCHPCHMHVEWHGIDFAIESK